MALKVSRYNILWARMARACGRVCSEKQHIIQSRWYAWFERQTD